MNVLRKNTLNANGIRFWNNLTCFVCLFASSSFSLCKNVVFVRAYIYTICIICLMFVSVVGSRTAQIMMHSHNLRLFRVQLFAPLFSLSLSRSLLLIFVILFCCWFALYAPLMFNHMLIAILSLFFSLLICRWFFSLSLTIYSFVMPSFVLMCCCISELHF